MSTVANRRALLEAVHTFVRPRDATAEQLKAVFGALAQVVTDVTGQECELVLRFKLGSIGVQPPLFDKDPTNIQY